MLGLSCGGPAAASLPPDDAPPDVVLATYLEALKAGDCATAHLLVTNSFTIGNGELCGALRVTRVVIAADDPAQPREGEVVFATTITVAGGDQSMPDGDHIWFYDLQRQDNGAWRITGGGSGP